MKSTSYITKPKTMKSVTFLPCWILTMKGKMDSRKSNGVCDEYIHSLLKKLAVMEAEEVVDVEKALFNVRKEAAAILSELSEKKEELSKIPNCINERSAEVIRNNRKNAEHREEVRKSLKKAFEKLTSLNEQIISVNTVLDERITKRRNNASEKIHAYIVGVKSGDLTDYTFHINEVDDQARQIYLIKHEILDKKIRDMVNKRMYEEVTA